jgi:predicted dinucleotide-binding enzyme
MKIGILGAGNVGKALGDGWMRHKHEIQYGERGKMEEAAAFGEVVVLAVPFQAALDIVPAVDLAGKTVIDCTNALGRVPGKTSSGAEAIQERVPGAKVVKCFNTTGANNMERPDYPGGPLAMLYCGDDAQAKKTVEGQIGFESYDLGPLSNARLLEAQAELWIWLASRGGLGREFGFRLVRR